MLLYCEIMVNPFGFLEDGWEILGKKKEKENLEQIAQRLVINIKSNNLLQNAVG